MDIGDFTFRTKKLVTRLLNQNFEKKKLVRVSRSLLNPTMSFYSNIIVQLILFVIIVVEHNDIFKSFIVFHVMCLKPWIITYLLDNTHVKQGRWWWELVLYMNWYNFSIYPCFRTKKLSFHNINFLACFFIFWASHNTFLRRCCFIMTFFVHTHTSPIYFKAFVVFIF